MFLVDLSLLAEQALDLFINMQCLAKVNVNFLYYF